MAGVVVLTVSIGIPVYNEERNIGHLLDELIAQQITSYDLRQIIVVASGCTDGTEEIVKGYCEKDPRIKLLVQKTREGKAAALNLYLQHTTEDIIIAESADTIPEKGAIEKLLEPFSDSTVGVTGARMVPTNPEGTFMGFCAHLYWNIVHWVALESFKTGEITAFRNEIKTIPHTVINDEYYMLGELTKKGYRLVYVPEAVVYNRGAETVSDYVKIRRRTVMSYMQLKAESPHIKIPNTMSVGVVARLVLSHMKWDLRSMLWTAALTALEFYGRLLALYDWHILKKRPYIWDTARSTKNLKDA